MVEGFFYGIVQGEYSNISEGKKRNIAVHSV